MRPSRISLRVRLVVALTGIALIVLVLSGVATYALVRRSLQQHSLQDMRNRSADLAAIVRSKDFATRPVQRFRIGLRATDMQAVVVAPDGSLVDRPSYQLPAELRPSDIQPGALLAGNEVSGRRGDTVFLALPTTTQALGGTLVVIATDRVDMTVLLDARPLIFIAGLLLLAAVALLSIWLARRLTRPIRVIERAAAQLATGDLSARAVVPPATDGELAAPRAP